MSKNAVVTQQQTFKQLDCNGTLSCPRSSILNYLLDSSETGHICLLRVGCFCDIVM